MADEIGCRGVRESDGSPLESLPALSLGSLPDGVSLGKDAGPPPCEPAQLFWLDRIQGPISIPWWKEVAKLPPSAHQVGLSLWLFRNMYRADGAIRWNRDRQRLLGTPLQSASDGLAHLRRAGFVQVLAGGPGRVARVQLTSPEPDPILDRTSWSTNGWTAIRGPISRPWIAAAARTAGARGRGEGNYRRSGATVPVGLSLWAVRNRNVAPTNIVSAGTDVLTLLGTRPDAARRALRALERVGLVKVVAKGVIEIVSPEPDPVLDGREAWKSFFVEKHGLVAWPYGPSAGRPSSRAEENHVLL